MMMITTIFHPLVSEFEAIFFSLSLPQSYVNNFNNFAEDFGIRFSFNNNVNIFLKVVGGLISFLEECSKIHFVLL